MKSTVAVILAFVFTTFISTSAMASSAKSKALNACKDHVSELYAGEQLTKVKRIKERGKNVEVKMRVSAEGERFNATCAFADGSLSYTTDQATSIAD